MLLRFSSSLFVIATALVPLSRAQFSCTLGNQDESSCLNSKDESSESCVWCNVSGFGFCVTEEQAESLEQNLPGIQCDRAPSSDDDNTKPSTDDDAPATNDDTPPPKDDDNLSPTDDSLPDNFWTCLQKKTSEKCVEADCTWCTSKKYGYGLCMTGPTAEAAADSDFFTCSPSPSPPSSSPQREDEGLWASLSHTLLRGAPEPKAATPALLDPTDPLCLQSFLNDPTEEGCEATVDRDGNPCAFCSYQQIQICLNQEQAEIAEELIGLNCGESVSLKPQEEVAPEVQDLTDPSCLQAFLNDPTEDGCEAALDSDGNPCSFCSYQQIQICLNQEQAEIAEELIGLSCGESVLLEPQEAVDPEVQDLTDPSCLQAFLNDPTEDGCEAALDSDGNPCSFCSYQQIQICLNQEQAEIAEELIGLDCGESVSEASEVQDPLDPSCLQAFLIDPTEEACEATQDNDGNDCEFCIYQQIQICLNQKQAEIGEEFIGFDCSSSSSSNKADLKKTKNRDPYDPSCEMAYLSNPTKEACLSTKDTDGAPCQLCSFQQGGPNLCLTQEQAEAGESLGWVCDNDDVVDHAKENAAVVANPLDSSCLMALVNAGGSMTPQDCTSVTDNDGIPCEFCSVAGVADSLCLTVQQADLMAQVAGDAVECGAHVMAGDNQKMNMEEGEEQPYDPTCVLAYLQDPTPSTCTNTVDATGEACEFCTLEQGAAALNLCLNAEQAEAAESLGIECGAAAVSA